MKYDFETWTFIRVVFFLLFLKNDDVIYEKPFKAKLYVTTHSVRDR
jgi:hypothetical protein